jgi:hypothetical protein
LRDPAVWRFRSGRPALGTRHNGRRVRALNPHAPADAALLTAISRGEFTLNGFRNRDLRTLLFNKAPGWCHAHTAIT